MYTMTLWTHNVMCLVLQSHNQPIVPLWYTHNHSCHVVQSKNLPTCGTSLISNPQSMLISGWERAYQQKIWLSVSDSLQCWMWMWEWTGHDLSFGTLVWHTQTVPGLDSTSLPLLRCQTYTWCPLALVHMGHKPGQVSHQEWCHSWEPAAVDLEDMSIVRFTPTQLHTSMVTYMYVLYFLHGVWLCAVQVHVDNHSQRNCVESVYAYKYI